MPREFPETGQVEFTSKVDKELHQVFIGLFPQHGATSWFIRTALKEFIEKVKDDAPAVERIREAIATTILNA